MTAYLIVDTKINDEESYKEYKTLSRPIVESFGGNSRSRWKYYSFRE